MATQKPKGWLDKFVSKVPKTFGNEVAASDATAVQPHGNYISVEDSRRKELAQEMARRQTYLNPASKTSTSDAMRKAAEDRIAKEKTNAFTKKIAEGAQTIGGALELAAPFTGPLMPIVGGVGAGLGIGSGVYLAGKDALEGNYGSAAMNAGFAGLDAAGFAALRNSKVKDLIQGADNISDFQQVADLSNVGSDLTNESLSNRLKNSNDAINSFLSEAIGAALPRKVPVQQAIDNANAWTKNWVNHPATQQKILTDFNKISPQTTQDYLQHSLNYEPNSALYPLSKQAEDLKDIIFSGETKRGGYKNMVHYNNSGVSYRHSWDPYFNGQDLINFPRQGTWISRGPFYSPKEIRSTTVHENFHDWLRNQVLTESGQYDDVLNSLQPDFVNHYKQWDDLRMQGVDPSSVMGKKNAFIGYMSNPTEVHARIGELRQKYKLTPSMYVTVNDINKMRAGEATKDAVVHKDFFNLFKDDREAANMFNRLWAAPAAIGAGAIATQNLSDAEPEQQRNGGWLDKFQPGGKLQATSTDSSKNKTATAQQVKKESQLQRYYGPDEFENCQGAGCSKIATTDIANTFGFNYGDLHPQDAWYRRASVLKNKGKEIWNPSMGNNYSGFRVGDLVSLNRSGDTYAKTASTVPGYTLADNEGNEHVGEYVGVNEKGIPLIKHGSEHGKIYVQPITDLVLPDAGPVPLYYKPQSVYRLAELENAEIKDKKFYTAPQKAIPIKWNNPNKKLTANEKKYLDAINANVGKQQQMFGLSPEEAKMINSLGYGIFHNESNAGNTSWKRPVALKMLGSELAHAFGRDASASLGDVQFKYDDLMYNADKSLSSVGRRMQDIGVKREGLSDWTHHRDDYNDEVNSIAAFMSDHLNKFKTNPKYKYDSKTNTIYGDIPVDRALTNIYHFGPTATKEKFLRNAKSYADKVINHVKELNYTPEAPKNISISKSPAAAAFMSAAKLATREDGGEVNYNDASTSFPPNFVGQGYDTTGRNYSPAWGGQFEDGGDLSFIDNPKLRNMLEGYKPGVMDTVNDYRLPEGRMAGSIYPSSEVSRSVGGEDGEPAYLIPSFKYGAPLQDYVEEFNMTGQHLGGPFKTWQDAEQFGELRHQYVEKRQPLPSPIATSNMAMGGSMPGAVGFMYARTQSPAPSNGKYAKKTKASAKDGGKMTYYQNGLDFEPKTISKNGSVIKDNMGQWAHPGEITEIGSNQITMQGVPYPVLGISDTGDTQMMYPNQEYQYNGSSVTEYPMMREGGALQLTKLDQLTNFTNYNTKQPGGWLDKYQD